MKKIYLYIVVAIFIVSSTETLLKLAGQSFNNGIQLNFLRFLIGGLFLLIPVSRRLKNTNRTLNTKDYTMFSLLGFLFVVISMTLYQFAIEIGTASAVAILFSFNPIFNTIFSCLILKQTLTTRNTLAIVISTLGLFIIIYQYIGNSYEAVISALMSAVVFGLYSTFSNEASKKYNLDVLTITCYSFLFGSIELAAFMAVSHVDTIASFLKQSVYLKKLANIPFVAGIDLNNFPFLLYLGIIITAGGFALYLICLKEVGPSLSSIIFFTKPAIAPIFASLILNEEISLYTMVGIMVIAIGSSLIYIENRRSQQN